MSKEIEYKFLVSEEKLKPHLQGLQPFYIIQGFLENDGFFQSNSRVFIKENKLYVYDFVWDILQDEAIEIQALKKDPHTVVRIRLKDDEAFLTIKGSGKINKGTTLERPEFEYAIPLKDGQSLLTFCSSFIEKERFEIFLDEKIWEIDFFKKNLDGLILAELEVSDADEQFIKPDFILEDVSNDHSYTNQQLSTRNKKWKKN